MAGLGAAVAALVLNSQLERLYLHYRPALERELALVLGHPLRLGAYRGLQGLGLVIGPSRIEASRFDRSHVIVQRLAVSLEPLASLQQGLPVLRLDISGARLRLRSRPGGPLWAFGHVAGPPPRLALQVRLRDPLQLRLSSDTARPLVLRGWSDVQLAREQLQASLQLTEADGGRLGLSSAGDWRHSRWQVSLRPRRLALNSALRFWPEAPTSPGHLGGRLDGGLTLDLAGGRLGCQGRLQLSAGRWQPSLASQPLEIPRLLARCSSSSQQPRSVPAWRIDRLDWRHGDWSGQVSGLIVPAQRLDLRSRAEQRPASSAGPGRDQLTASLVGPWRGARLSVHGQLRPRTLGLPGSRPLPLSLSALLVPAPSLAVRQLDLRLDQSRLQAEGTLSPVLALRGQASIAPPDLPIERSWQALLRPVQARFALSRSALDLQPLRSGPLQLAGRIPYRFTPAGALETGPVALDLQLRELDLARLTPALGVELQGHLSADGQLRGPLRQLQPDLSLQLVAPGLGPLQLSDTWAGNLSSQPDGQHLLRLGASSPLRQGRLQARFAQTWQPLTLKLERGDGWLAARRLPAGSAVAFELQAFPLEGAQIALGPRQRLQPIQGLLSGRGQLQLAPWRLNAQVALSAPALLGVQLDHADLRLGLSSGRVAVAGLVRVPDGGRLQLALRGEPWGVGGRGFSEWSGTVAARQLQSPFLRQLADALPLWNGEAAPGTGRASDLGTLMIDTLGQSLGEQIQALIEARERQQQRQQAQITSRRGLRLDDLQSRVDADLRFSTPQHQQLWLDLTARAHLWLTEDDQDKALTLAPLVARVRGPLAGGGGSFSVERLPLSLLALLTPVPTNLRGALAVQGRYRLGRDLPDVSADLSLQDAAVGDTALILSPAQLRLDRQGLWQLKASLQSPGHPGSLDLVGQIPLDPRRQDLKVRIQSRDDGLRFLTSLAGPGLSLDQGSADLLLLLRGSVAEPLANGVLRVDRGELRVAGQTIRDLSTLVVFDFNALEVQTLSGRIGRSGAFNGQGRLGLVQWFPQPQPLQISLKAIPLRSERLEAQLDGALTITGSLREPGIGGSLQLSRGRIQAQPGELARPDGAGAGLPVTMARLREQNWSFDQPLRLFGSEVESDAGAALRAAIPLLPQVSLRRLALRFGPDLRIVVPGLANFSTGGSLVISGRLDPSLQLSGVVRLLSGRLNLFTTSFSLDPDSPNVAVFTPSLGLIPYVDVALRTRVSDTVNLGRQQSGSLTTWDLQSSSTPLDQLRLVRVTLQASGPADRLVDQIRLRSSPPLPEDRLLALIGGNSLAGLSSGNAGTALATVVGQTLLSPLVGSLTEAFGQRFSFALYPTYVVPSVSGAAGRSGGVPSELVLGSEIGLDLNDRVNLSVLAAPNRSDIPPQITVRYQANDRLGVQGAVDGEGRWQTQLQLYLRF